MLMGCVLPRSGCRLWPGLDTFPGKKENSTGGARGPRRRGGGPAAGGGWGGGGWLGCAETCQGQKQPALRTRKDTHQGPPATAAVVNHNGIKMLSDENFESKFAGATRD